MQPGWIQCLFQLSCHTVRHAVHGKLRLCAWQVLVKPDLAYTDICLSFCQSIQPAFYHASVLLADATPCAKCTYAYILGYLLQTASKAPAGVQAAHGVRRLVLGHLFHLSHAWKAGGQ